MVQRVDSRPTFPAPILGPMRSYDDVDIDNYNPFDEEEDLDRDVDAVDQDEQEALEAEADKLLREAGADDLIVDVDSEGERDSTDATPMEMEGDTPDDDAETVSFGPAPTDLSADIVATGRDTSRLYRMSDDPKVLLDAIATVQEANLRDWVAEGLDPDDMGTETEGGVPVHKGSREEAAFVARFQGYVVQRGVKKIASRINAHHDHADDDDVMQNARIAILYAVRRFEHDPNVSPQQNVKNFFGMLSRGMKTKVGRPVVEETYGMKERWAYAMKDVRIAMKALRDTVTGEPTEADVALWLYLRDEAREAREAGRLPLRDTLAMDVATLDVEHRLAEALLDVWGEEGPGDGAVGGAWGTLSRAQQIQAALDRLDPEAREAAMADRLAEVDFDSTLFRDHRSPRHRKRGIYDHAVETVIPRAITDKMCAAARARLADDRVTEWAEAGPPAEMRPDGWADMDHDTRVEWAATSIAEERVEEEVRRSLIEGIQSDHSQVEGSAGTLTLGAALLQERLDGSPEPEEETALVNVWIESVHGFSTEAELPVALRETLAETGEGALDRVDRHWHRVRVAAGDGIDATAIHGAITASAGVEMLSDVTAGERGFIVDVRLGSTVEPDTVGASLSNTLGVTVGVDPADYFETNIYRLVPAIMRAAHGDECDVATALSAEISASLVEREVESVIGASWTRAPLGDLVHAAVHAEKFAVSGRRPTADERHMGVVDLAAQTVRLDLIRDLRDHQPDVGSLDAAIGSDDGGRTVKETVEGAVSLDPRPDLSEEDRRLLVLMGREAHRTRTGGGGSDLQRRMSFLLENGLSITDRRNPTRIHRPMNGDEVALFGGFTRASLFTRQGGGLSKRDATILAVAGLEGVGDVEVPVRGPDGRDYPVRRTVHATALEHRRQRLEEESRGRAR